MTFSEYRASCACYQCRYGNLSSRPKSVFQNPAPNIPNTSHNFGSPITVPTVKTSGSTSYSQMKQSIPRKPLSATKNNTAVDINRLKSYHSPIRYKPSQSQNESHTVTTSNTAQYTSKNISADLNQSNDLMENYKLDGCTSVGMNERLEDAINYVDGKQIPNIKNDQIFEELIGAQANQTTLLGNPELVEVNISLKSLIKMENNL